MPAPPTAHGEDLPITAALPAFTAAVAEPGAAVLVAPPGSGKTTVAPLALADAVDGRVLVAEPRRVAVRAAARRMADLTRTALGEHVGYTVRGDSRTSAATRVEVVTTGVLVQRLQRDPELPGVAAVMLDECHERHLDTDLALAFTADVRANLRPDLTLIAASATAEAERIAAAVGPSAPIVTAHAAPHPLDVRHRAPARPVDPPHGLRVDPRLLDHVAATVREALAGHDGDVLVFLPGTGEIAAVRRRLDLPRVDVLALHGGQSGTDQDAALRRGPRRRVVLATAVAESSLTVPGVRVVVDAGLARVPRVDHARGLGSLVTVRASRAAADQRAGRAAREGPGTVYRCWPAAEHDRLPAHPDPEIATADLTAFVLQLACWGHPDGRGLALLDSPPEASAATAAATLAALGALDGGRVTERGRRMAAVGAHPRLARALLDGAVEVGADRAAEIVALLSAETRPGGDDLTAVWRDRRSGADRAATAAWRTETRRLRSRIGRDAVGPRRGGVPDDLAAGLIVGLAHPERLARTRAAGGTDYLMASGTAAALGPGTALLGAPWLAIADAARQPGHRDARIRLAVPVDEATARRAGAATETTEDVVAWRDGDVRAASVTRLGAIVLTERRLPDPPRKAVAAAIADGFAAEGLGLLTWTREARALRARLAFCRHALGDPWPAVDDEALVARAGEWVGPELAAARRRADLARLPVAAALRRLLPYDLAGRLDATAPERITVPSGSRIAVDYTDPAAPVLAVKVQEVFGWTRTPNLAGGRVPVVLHLLSPAGRPAAVTADLASFWGEGYRQVRAQLRGRYPRHPWPEDPASAEPTRRAKPRR